MICVDASLAVKWVLAEEHTPQATSLYRATLLAGEPIIAPPLLPIEATNILRQRMRRQPPLSQDDALRLLDQFLSFSVALRNPPGLHRLALKIAADYGLSAAYDAHYVALAQTAGCDLWTADQRLLRELGGRLSFVRAITEYQG